MDPERQLAQVALGLEVIGRLDVAVISTSIDGTITSWNAGAESLYGYAADEVLGENITIVYPPEEQPAADAVLGAIRRGEGVTLHLAMRRRRDGTSIAVEMHAAPLLDSHGVTIGAVAFAFDASERVEQQLELRQVNEFLQRTQEIAHIGSFHTHVGPEQSMRLTAEAYRILGLDPGQEVRNLDFFQMVDPDDRRVMAETMARARLERTPATVEVRITRADGARRWLSLVIDPVPDDERAPSRAIGVVQDITERRELADSLEHDALHDRLTGLPNRLLFLDRLELALNRADDDRAPIALFYADLDRFQLINDTKGAAFGDELLRAVASRLAAAIRPTDTVTRNSADEFVVLAERIRGPVDAAQQAQVLLDLFAPPFAVDGEEIFVTASIGVAVSEHGSSAPELLRDANLAMSQAKQRGRNRFEIYDLRLREQTERRVELEAGLRRSFANDELFLEFQPILSLRTGRFVGAEALLRWAHPERGVVYPTEFIELAEETGIIVPIGKWAIEHSCRVVAGWRAAAPEADLRMSVNISPAQLRDANFVRILADAVDNAGIPSSAIRLELTESMLIENEANRILLDALRESDAKLSIDDFGTKYSALAYLARFPIHELKIDREFVGDAVEDETHRAVIAAIVALGHALRLEIVAEGVENDEQLRLVRALGCDHVQGNLISPPVGADRCLAMLRGEAGSPG